MVAQYVLNKETRRRDKRNCTVHLILSKYPFNYRVKLLQKKSKNLYIPTDNDVKLLIQHFKDKGAKDCYLPFISLLTGL